MGIHERGIGARPQQQIDGRNEAHTCSTSTSGDERRAAAGTAALINVGTRLNKNGEVGMGSTCGKIEQNATTTAVAALVPFLTKHIKTGAKQNMQTSLHGGSFVGTELLPRLFSTRSGLGFRRFHHRRRI